MLFVCPPSGYTHLSVVALFQSGAAKEARGSPDLSATSSAKSTPSATPPSTPKSTAHGGKTVRVTSSTGQAVRTGHFHIWQFYSETIWCDVDGRWGWRHHGGGGGDHYWGKEVTGMYLEVGTGILI